MYKKVAVLTACMAAASLLLVVGGARAEDPASEGGGAAASPAEMPDICKAQAAKRNLTGAEADEYLKKCAAPLASGTERSAVPEDERLEGQL
jgi:hypothetical protein